MILNHHILTSGVPPGSILGSVLFLLYINNFELCLCKADMFSDDSTLYTSGIGLKEVQHQLHKDADNISKFCKHTHRQNTVIHKFIKQV